MIQGLIFMGSSGFLDGLCVGLSGVGGCGFVFVVNGGFIDVYVRSSFVGSLFVDGLSLVFSLDGHSGFGVYGGFRLDMSDPGFCFEVVVRGIRRII